jgi:hypothetical protein
MEANFFDSRVFLKTAALRQVDADLPIRRLDAAAGCDACAPVRSYEPPMSLVVLLCRFLDAGEYNGSHALDRPASKKRQGTKSRSVAGGTVHAMGI